MRREIQFRDPDRKWTGVKKVRDVVIGETHAERARRKNQARLLRQIELERREVGVMEVLP